MKKKAVVIIGGGIAGLAAAEKLSRRFKVTLLEASNRLGGRIHTDYSWKQPHELGAQVIHGVRGNPVAKLARKNKLAMRSSDYFDFYLYDPRGQLLPDSEVQKHFALFQEAVAALSEHAGRNANVERALRRDRRIRSIPKIYLDWFMQSEAVYSGAELKFHAATEYDQENEFPGKNVFIRRGYDGILKALNLKKVNILLRQPVLSIEYDRRGTVIRTDGGLFEADYAVVTLPLGVLKAGAVAFKPELPAWKTGAIRRLGMGVLDLVYLHFPKVFWPNGKDFIGIAGPNGGFSRFANRYRLTGEPVLVGTTGGSTARELENSADKEVVRHAMQTLRGVFGRKIPNPDRVQITRWASNPFAYGSYSYIAAGTKRTDFKIMAKSVGRILFAGEATNYDYPCTVHGAYLSGQREAARLLKS